MGKWPPSQSWRPTSTTPCPQYRDQSHPFHDAPRPIYRNVGLEKFDGKMDEWENWAHQFRVFTQLYNWTDNEQLIHLVSSLRGPALTAHRSFSQAECATVEACMHALDMRYGSKRPLTIASLRADLSVAKQEEGEGVDTFGDRLLGLTHRAYPGMAPDWIQGLSVPAFLKGLKDKVSGQEAMKFGKPQTITDAVEQVMHLRRCKYLITFLKRVLQFNLVSGSPPKVDTLLASWYPTYMQSFIISHSTCAEQYGDMSADTQTHTHTDTQTHSLTHALLKHQRLVSNSWPSLLLI